MVEGNIKNPFNNLSNPPSLDYLTNLLSKLKRKGYYYYRKKINLDGLTFEECSFENCEFVTYTGNFNLINCRIYGPETKFLYGGQALKIAKFHELMNSSVNNRIVFPDLFPSVDKDGRVTL